MHPDTWADLCWSTCSQAMIILWIFMISQWPFITLLKIWIYYIKSYGPTVHSGFLPTSCIKLLLEYEFIQKKKKNSAAWCIIPPLFIKKNFLWHTCETISALKHHSWNKILLLPCDVNQTSISVCDWASPRQRLPLGVFWPRLHLSTLVALKVPAASGAGGAKAPLNTERISNAERFRGAVTSIKSILTLY